MDIDINTVLANQARGQELRQRIAKLQGSATATASVVSILASLNNDTSIQLADAQSTLSALEAGAGPGVTVDFGPKTTVTQMSEAERLAGIGAVVDLVKSAPATTEDEAAAAWDAAAAVAHPTFLPPLHNAKNVNQLYRANLLAASAISEDTWAAQAAWIVATDKATILAM